MAGVYQRRRDDVNLTIRQAHMTAVFSRSEKLEDVDRYLIGGTKRQHPAGQVPAGEGLAAWATVLEGMTKRGKSKT